MSNALMNSVMEIFRYSYMFNMKSGQDSLDSLLLPMIFILISHILTNEELLENLWGKITDLVSYKKYNTIIIEGKRCLRMNDYQTRTDQLFSDRFKAIWYYLAKNIYDNNTIYSIKEYSDTSNIYDEQGLAIGSNRNIRNFENGRKISDFFIVNQERSFVLHDNIMCKVSFKKDNKESNNKTNNAENKVEIIKIKIFSKNQSLDMMKKFIDDLTNTYISEIQNTRVNKHYIYTLLGPDPSDEDTDYEYDKFNTWEECEFVSTRRFDNLFFEDKEKVISKINFFQNNKEWYEKEGHPYTFGMGLSGPPGTGKTSIIKCIANMLNRHLIIIPLNKIKTQKEFSHYYFEDRYNRNNNSNSINFDNKIIVFEDIDCMTDIVKKRSSNKRKFGVESNDQTNKLLKKIVKRLNDDNKDKGKNDDSDNNDFDLERDFAVLDKVSKSDDKLTLSYLLNIIDGLRETPGRIIIMTSNNYDSLDDALVRPGRVDYTLKMNNASVNIIHEMFYHYYSDNMDSYYDKNDKTNKELLHDFIVSPAEIVNIKLSSDTPKEFVENLFILLKKKLNDSNIS